MDFDDENDASRYSDGSSEEMALAEAEERLYSLVYHSSDTFDLPSNIDNSVSSITDSPKSHQVLESNQRPVDQPEYCPTVRSKVSRLNNVKQIIDYADRKRDYDNIQCQKFSGRVLNDQSKSLYFEELTKDLSKLPPRQADISTKNRSWRRNPLHNTHQNGNANINNASTNFVGKESDGSNRLSPKSFLRNLEKNSINEKNTNESLKSFSFNLANHFLATSPFLKNSPGQLFSPNNLNHNDTNQPTVFRLDDRLFTNTPRYVHGEMTPNIKKKLAKKNKRKQKRKLEESLSPGLTSEEVTIVDVRKPTNMLKSKVTVDKVQVVVLDAIDTKYQIVLKPKPSLIVESEVIILDSDGEESVLVSDSDESVLLVSVPLPPAPVVIAVEDSSEEEPPKRTIPKETQPDLDPEHIENSFDFLDNSYDIDGLAKSQARLLSNLISSHGSKESLLDESFFEELPMSAAVTDDDLPNQDANISSSTASNLLKTLHAADKSSANGKALSSPAVSEEGATLFKPPSKQAKNKDCLNIKSPQKKNLKENCTVIKKERSIQAVSLLCGTVDIETTKILDYINARIESRKTGAAHQFKIPESTEHIVTKPAAVDTEVVTIDDDVVMSPPGAVSGKKRKREERKKERDEVEMFEDVVAIHSGSKVASDVHLVLADGGVAAQGTSKSARKKQRKMDADADLAVAGGDAVSRKALRRTRKRLLKKLGKERERFGAGVAIVYTEILGDEYVGADTLRDPVTWTREMRRFYNNSWGGENMDIEAIQRQMPGNPQMWKLSNADLHPSYGGPRRRQDVRCHNCRQPGHMSYQCNRQSATACVMCGNMGHNKERCSNSLCLQCGQPGRGFSKECGQCRGGNAQQVCPRCVYLHDRSQPCRDTPRRSSSAAPRPVPWYQGDASPKHGGQHQNNYNPYNRNRRNSRW